MASRLHNRGRLVEARLKWARAHPDRAAEVGVTLGDRTKRYDLHVEGGVPRLVGRDVTP